MADEDGRRPPCCRSHARAPLAIPPDNISHISYINYIGYINYIRHIKFILMENKELTIGEIYRAQMVLRDIARHPKIIGPTNLSDNCDVYLKPENLQYTGAFKLRGAAYKISQLTPEEKAKGVIACSAGNHAQGVALSATRSGIKSLISDKLIIIPQPVYNYRIRTSGSIMSSRKMKMNDDLVKIFFTLRDFAEKYVKGNEDYWAYRGKIFGCLASIVFFSRNEIFSKEFDLFYQANKRIIKREARVLLAHFSQYSFKENLILLQFAVCPKLEIQLRQGIKRFLIKHNFIDSAR